MQKIFKAYRNKIADYYPFLIIYSFFLMLFFTESSPLFTFSEWVDSQAFFTVGKGIANGLVPYRDLFEQKGPLLYALNALAYMINHTNFNGVFILEILSMFVNLLLAFKISRLYLNWMPSAIITILFPIFILNENAFRFGDSAEEFAIPFLLAFLYYLLRNFKYSPYSNFKWSFFLINGILIGCVFWIKFTLVGAWIGFYLAILFLFIVEKRWNELINAFFFTLGGLIIATIPWLIYFGINHSIKDFYDVYIKFNIVLYSKQISIFGKLINSAIIFGRAFNRNFETKIMIIIGIVNFMFSLKYLLNKKDKLIFLNTISFLILGVYFGGRESPYYFLIITPLSLFGLISIGEYFQNPKGDQQTFSERWIVIAVAAVSTIFLCFGYNSNIKTSKLFNKIPSAQQNFAKMIRSEPNPTLLNYGFLDGGFYLLANIVPNIRYFERQNIDYNLYPENMDEQNRYVKEGIVKFIVVRIPSSEPINHVEIPHLYDHYQLVNQQEQLVEGLSFRYLLYKKIR